MRAEWIPGDHATWTTLGGRRYEGTVQEVDSNVLIVRCTDGKTRAVEGWVKLPETHERNVLVRIAAWIGSLWGTDE